jgi:CHASE2 domain-containing sensor protein
MRIWRAFSRQFRWLGISGLLLVIVVGFLSYKYEDFKEDFPRLITFQLWTYQLFDHPENNPGREQRVMPIEIDDRTFYEFLGNEGRNESTDRLFLAKLVDAATLAGAAVIALDINLDATRHDRAPGSANALANDDQALLLAIQRAQDANIPVVLTFGFRPDLKPVPQVLDGVVVYGNQGISYQFPEEESPPRPFWVPRFGFDHPGDDYRKVPLVATGLDETGTSVDYYSFALQITDAYEQKEKKPSAQSEEKVLADTLANHEFVYTTFMPVRAFAQPTLSEAVSDGPISGIEVVCTPAPGKAWNTAVCDQRNPKRAELAPGLLKGHIVLIGGDRHGNKGEAGEEDYLDNRESPVGPLRGMYFQANYVEGLLDNRVLYKMKPGVAAAIDVALALAVLYVLSRRRWKVRKLVLIFLLLTPIFIGYLAAMSFHRCIDFVFPLVLLFLHPALEGYIHLFFGSHQEEVAHG